LVTLNDIGATPLHLACYTKAPIDILRLLVRRGPSSLRLVDQDGDTPLHCICSVPSTCDSDDVNGADQAIRLLVEGDPTTLLLGDKSGLTPLHRACSGDVPVPTLAYMTEQCHYVVCLFLDDDEDEDADSGRFLPYHWTIEQDRCGSVVENIADASIQAACAMIELVLSSRGRSCTFSASVRQHVVDTITAAIPDLDAAAIRDMSACALTETVNKHAHLTPDLVRNLVNHETLQTILKGNAHIQRLIGGLVRMNQSGRNYTQLAEPYSNDGTCKAMRVLDSISDNVDCLFLHLRENEELVCFREHTTISKPKAAAAEGKSSAQKHDRKTLAESSQKSRKRNPVHIPAVYYSG
jgi:hypothetical protein